MWNWYVTKIDKIKWDFYYFLNIFYVMQSMGNTTMFHQEWIKATQKCALSYHVYNTCC